MIKDEQEYAVSQDALSRFEDSLQRLTNSAGDGDNPVLRRAELEGMRVQIARLHQEIADYETLRLGQTRVIASSSSTLTDGGYP